ncbi:hypothetical protein [Streptosporangium canum]|uniref:hypothetical protein n=1 Tax=Streptosporangium canum TaxID=324952 RepID=UPI0033B3B6DC
MAQPNPTVTVTKTVISTPTPKPDDVPLTDHLQGWGTLLAAIVAAAGLWVAIRTAKRDREEADQQLKDERNVADDRLQRQLNDQRERDRRQFVAEQLQKAALYWSRREIAQLPGVLVAIPDQYATILRYLVRGEDYNDIAGFPPMSPVTHEALKQQLTGRGLDYHGAEQYLIDKSLEMERGFEREGKSKDWGRMAPWAAELYRIGYDYEKVRPAWLYEEIGQNIAELLDQTEPADG